MQKIICLLLVALSIVAVCWSHSTLPLTKFQRNLRNIKKELTSTNEAILNLGGSFQFSEFYVTMNFGTPAESFYLQADTGSSDTVIWGPGCQSCSADGLIFGPSTTEVAIACPSTTYTCRDGCYEARCYFDIEYGSGQLEGTYATDVVSFTGSSISMTTFFGLAFSATSPSGYFEPLPVHGILGMALPALAEIVDSNGRTPFYELLNSCGVMAFSMCLTDTSPALLLNTPYTHNSVASISNSFNFTPSIGPYYYGVGLQSIEVSGVVLPTSLVGYTTIVDSGTTFLYLPGVIFAALTTAFNAHCPLHGFCGTGVAVGESIWNGYCYPFSASQFASLPSLSFVIGTTPSFTLTLTGSQYMQPYVYGVTTYYCLGIGNSGTSLGNLIILGDTVMRNYHVSFDLQNQYVGFGPLSSC